MDVDSTSLPPRISGRVIANTEAAVEPTLSAASRSSFLAGRILRGADVVQSRSHGNEDATSFRHNRPANALDGRDNGASHGLESVQEALNHVAAGKDPDTLRHDQSRKQQQQIPSSNSNSQDTSTTNGTTDTIFTPPASAGGLSRANSQGNGQDSSQESQLLQPSQTAAAPEKMQNSREGSDGSNDLNGGQSRKRMADGMVKSASEGSTASPVFRGGHSRNTSTVSVATTTGSRLGEVCPRASTRYVSYC